MFLCMFPEFKGGPRSSNHLVWLIKILQVFDKKKKGHSFFERC